MTEWIFKPKEVDVIQKVNGKGSEITDRQL